MLCAGLGFAAALGACSSSSSGGSSAPPAVAAPSAGPTVSPTMSPTMSPTASPSLSAREKADRRAGLRSRTVVWQAKGTLRTVAGDTRPPKGSSGRLYRVRVEVERGLDVDGRAFADFVLDTLNDDRSWSHDGAKRFARTDGAYDVRVVLASPATSARLCRPLVTYGKLSCGSGTTAVLTMYRWVKGIPEYSKDLTGYRHYVVNHEVGHTLGHGHEYCAGKGKVAPVMMQQTKGLKGCRPSPWPYP
ncbi:DUF3152 domain-containing protein [Spongisporangium articulatum]|uniref:DUF3152 domain-containing protein n=1 Tax=Spongisporangium articulatum TaxID=3362603 RepID=A0ABW8ARA3_9ACTN